MPVVLDTCTLIDYCRLDEKTSILDSAIGDNTCYIAPSCAAEAIYLIRKHAGPQRAEMVFIWIMSNTDIRLFTDCDAHMLDTMSRMRELGVSAESCSTAAIAQKLGADVVLSGPAGEYAVLEKAGYCRLRTI